MKIVDKTILYIFSVIILLTVIMTSCLIFGWVDATTIYLVISNILSNSTTCNILIGINALICILAIKTIFFPSSSNEEKYNDGILLENDDGKLLITRETLTNIVDSVVSGFESVKNTQTKILLDQENNLSIILTIDVSDNAIIKELSNNIQLRVKDTIKKSLDVEIKSLDIRIKRVIKKEETTV